MFRSKTAKVTISFPRKAMEAVFDECDKFDVDETGGRIIGTYQKKGKQYEISVLGIIDPGPNARRSPTSFFQDGDYQERVFREVEKEHPNLEHLGNWHTHHVNGLTTLSSGDRVTYQRIVNHDKHNTDFFYALLVVRKTDHPTQRYEVKHYLVFRNDDTFYEIPNSQLSVVDDGGRSSLKGEQVIPFASFSDGAENETGANPERVKDQEFFSEFFPGLKPGFSNGLGTLYWKGKLNLIDGSQANVLAMECLDRGKHSYSITVPGPNPPDVVNSYRDRTFRSARHAILNLERDINHEVFLRRKRH
jgi:hypothetical protein